MTKELIINIFNESLERLYEYDYHLIKNQASERAIVASLGFYLKQYQQFNNYHIDVEYNREGEENGIKKMLETPTTADLIIHTRGNTSQGNLVYLEAKTYYNISKNKKNKDIDAINYFIQKYGYEYGIFLYFGKTLEECYFEIKLCDSGFQKINLQINKNTI